MAKSRRPPIPQSVSDELLFQSDHTCCICRVREKDVQIHHIDGNASNNKIANLVVTCLDCHSRMTGSRGLGKAHTAGEVRKYKRSWEQFVQDTRKVHKPRIKHKKELISQIDLIVCDILARKKNSPRIEELLNILYEIHLWRGSLEIDSKIVDGLHHLAIMTGLDSPRTASMVAEKLWEMCFHFVGPGYVQMNKRSQEYVMRCVSALGTLAMFNCEYGHGRKAVESIVENAENFFEITVWYNRRNIANKVLHVYEEGIKGCYEDEVLKFAFGRTALRKSLRKLAKMLDDEQMKWPYQRHRVKELLKL